MEQPSYAIDHVQITAPRALAEAMRRFYADGLGLPELAKPPELARNGGTWFRVGSVQLHVAIEDAASADNEASRRHIAYAVADLAAVERLLRARGLEVLPDRQPSAGMLRFYLRDPAGNRIEILQRTP
jgi:catechol 2,3-dioxygenase-like lactoylglutathione lyase family enzyme